MGPFKVENFKKNPHKVWRRVSKVMVYILGGYVTGIAAFPDKFIDPDLKGLIAAILGLLTITINGLSEFTSEEENNGTGK